MAALDLQPYRDRLEASAPARVYGKIVDVVGLTIEATGPALRVGDLCFVHSHESQEEIPVEVVGFRGDRVLLMPLGEMRGIGPGSLVRPTHQPQRVRVGEELLGAVLDGLGRRIDGGQDMRLPHATPLMAAPPAPMERNRILEPLATGVRAIDACVTCGKGQRIGVLAGSGVGKSKLLGMIARNTSADVNVIALIGERGREVRDFIETDLGEEGLARSVVVAATSDQPALVRINGAYRATAIAEYYRAQGADVLLMMDSVTRFAMAQREVGLAVGEPPTTKGLPPSVYSLMPRLLERAGNTRQGSITGVYAVLVEGDDPNDPIADAVRSIVDGHITLSRELATRNHYPAVDVLESISRVMIDVVSEERRTLAGDLRHVLATYRQAEDLINIGAYVPESNPEIDRAIRLMPAITAFLRQGLYEQGDFEAIPAQLRDLLGG